MVRRILDRDLITLATESFWPRGRAYKPSASYDAFISYGRSVDSKLAISLQRSLHNYAKPWYRLRGLHIFRDDGSLAATSSLGNAIESALANSRFLILLASKVSAQSEWVGREARYWCDNKPVENILLVVTDPPTERRIHWNKTTNDFDWNHTTSIGGYLAKTFHDEPRYVDLGWFRSRNDASLRDPAFVEAIADLAAPLRGVPKDQLIGEDVRQHRRARRWIRWTITALAMFAALTTIAAIVAVQQRNDAVSRTTIAEAEQYAAQALSQSDPFAALSLAVAAEEHTPSPLPAARAAYSTVLGRLPNWTTRLVTDLNGDWGLRNGGAITWSPDGHEFDASRSDGTVLRWRFNDAQSLPEVGKLAEPSLNARWSADRRTQLLIDTPVVTVRDIRADHPAPIPYTVHGATDAEISPDGHILLVADEDTLQRWDTTSGTPLGPNLAQARRSFPHVAWSPNGAEFAVIDSEKSKTPGVEIYDAHSTTTPSDPGLAVGFWSLTWSPDSLQLALGEEHGPIHIVDSKGSTRVTLTGHTGRVEAIKWSPTSRLIASAGEDGTVRIWDSSTGREVGSPLLGRAGSGATDIAWSPDGKYLLALFAQSDSLSRYASLNSDSLRAWEVGGQPHSDSILTDLNGRISSVAWSHDGRYLAGVDDAGALCVWNSAGNAVLSKTRLPGTNLSWSPDNSTIATSADDGLRLWKWSDPASKPGVPLWNSGGSISLAWSPDGSQLASGNDRGFIQIWRIGQPNPSLIHVGSGQSLPDAQIRSLAWLDNGTALVGISSDGTIHKWDVANGATAESSVHVVDTSISSTSWSQDGTRLAIGDLNGIVFAFDASGKQVMEPITTGGGAPLDLSWSPDNAMLASSGSNGRIVIWDIGSSSSITASEDSRTRGFSSLSWSPDGSELAAGNSEHQVRIWRSLTEREACDLAVPELTLTTLTRLIAPIGLAACSDNGIVRTFGPIPVIA